MDSSVETPTKVDSPEYRCPGERYTIDQSTHLGRLANFYAKCRTCPHQDDTATLSTSIVKRLVESRRHASVPPVFEGDALQGAVGQSLTVEVARSVAQAFGIWLHRNTSQDGAPRAIVAGDGRPLTAQVVAALGQGLAWAGCCVVDVGRVVAPAAVDAQASLEADGAITVGNAPGQPQTASVRLFGLNGCPLSTGGELQQIKTLLASTLDRPTRHAPPPERSIAEDSYLDRLREYFHALRPLRFVLDTPSPIIIDWTAELLTQVACSAILLRDGRQHVGDHALAADFPHASSSDVPTNAGSQLGSFDVTHSLSTHRGRSRDVARAVKEATAHFGLAIDGDGQALEVWDENGSKLSSDELFVMLATLGLDGSPCTTVVVNEHFPAKLVEVMRTRGIDVVVTVATSTEMHRAMIDHNAVLGLGPNGLLWHRNSVPMADALQTLARLLAALSQSDRPLSTVIAQL